MESVARPGKLFTVHATLLTAEVGRLRATAFERIRQGVVSMFARFLMRYAEFIGRPLSRGQAAEGVVDVMDAAVRGDGLQPLRARRTVAAEPAGLAEELLEV